MRPGPSLQPFLEVKRVILAIFADLCKDLQRCRKDEILEPFFGSNFLEFYGVRGFLFLDFYRGAEFFILKCKLKFNKN